MESSAVISSFVILNFARSFFFGSMINLLAGFRHLCVKSIYFLFTHIDVVSVISREDEGDQGTASDGCMSVNDCCSFGKRRRLASLRRRGVPTAADIALVMERLGVKLDDVAAECDGRCGECFALETAEGLLEEKIATSDELGAAYAVFDRDGDGYVGAEELQAVIWRRLGWKEAADLENCRAMIRAFDMDGDGRIDRADFERLLERAT